MGLARQEEEKTKQKAKEEEKTKQEDKDEEMK
jgi:hypothetical protein